MVSIINLLGRSVGQKASLFAVTASALVGIAGSSNAMAHDRSNLNIDIRIGDRNREPEYCERKVRVLVPACYRTVCEQRYVEAVYEDRCDRVWVEPVYQDVCQKVWCEPVYETRCERVLCPEVCQFREVRRYDSRCGRWESVRERVVVSPAHYDNRETRVLVCAGHFDEVHNRVCVTEGHFNEVHNRVCVTPGHYEKFDRQEVVAEAHYEWRTERVRGEQARNPVGVINPFLIGLNR